MLPNLPTARSIQSITGIVCRDPARDSPRLEAQMGKAITLLSRASLESQRSDVFPWTPFKSIIFPMSLSRQWTRSLSSTSIWAHRQNEGKSKAENERFKGPEVGSMTTAQKRIYDEIVRTRPTTGISGPFGPWLVNPKLAEPSQNLGRVCRFETSLDLRRSELIILVTAATQKSKTEWIIHKQEAINAGLEPEIVEHIDTHVGVANCDQLPSLADPIDDALFKFAAEVAQHKTVSDRAYWQLQELCGDQVCVEVVGIVGYYTYVAMTLNTFQILPN